MDARSAEAEPSRGARVLDAAPSEAVGPAERLAPLRKPPGFAPAVQRWSFLLPAGEAGMHIAFFGAQAESETELGRHPMRDWIRTHLAGHVKGPTCLDHARSRLSGGRVEHVVCAYWVSAERFEAWRADAEVENWWHAPERLAGPHGAWREILWVPRERQESIYWKDYPAGLMTSPDVAIFPTPYCGYYGAMRDRLPAAASESLDAPDEAGLVPCRDRVGYGEHWSVRPPHNLALIRSANTWGRMDAEQRADYEAKLRSPLEAGMEYLADNPLPSGCACMRWQGTTDADGRAEPEAHAHAYFLSLRHMERWAEDHATHAAIFGAAIQRYRHYGPRNQLRTWHEVYVLPGGGQRIEYLNCDPRTGLLPWFEAERVA
ncbi:MULTISPECIES: phenylacetaldoxime dehydratase family protein [unclassified Methylobacterium]|uniref:phenylacetaldoxime dehydratase family protein n=1 Tax=unclassified Methylobacterium TaxID=2615210 RepID=UPI0003AB1AFF|nr:MULTISPECIES: phenylacetaldoxime dehydratase family protein [unclassified Methylobacterium]SEG67364.1 aldoxime dehydratase [Methylobacterium sp. 190mf]